MTSPPPENDGWSSPRAPESPKSARSFTRVTSKNNPFTNYFPPKQPHNEIASGLRVIRPQLIAQPDPSIKEKARSCAQVQKLVPNPKSACDPLTQYPNQQGQADHDQLQCPTVPVPETGPRRVVSTDAEEFSEQSWENRPPLDEEDHF